MTVERTMLRRIRQVPGAGPVLSGVARFLRDRSFTGSQRYWEDHYATGGTSGHGSIGRLAAFKAETLNAVVARYGVSSVIEFGCGDGEQLALADYPRYLGLDVSPTTLTATMAQFAGDRTKSFLYYDPARFVDHAGLISADLALSLDVIYHLVEDDVYDLHLDHVFGSARRLVVLYTSDADSLTVIERTSPHVLHRRVLHDVAERFPRWRLSDRIPNRYPYQGSRTETSFADFLIYEFCG
ncbi:class I SAM-dependent methyltransferase [Winogradskya humida]|uniref:Methyltransferase family protein n=1 Tax=Winogradskya humida TaxID=113566 RepID=A0ABQ3ZY23_9ACTN|nr:class I SAM-dependent methyltransferase [Actinoplanes humidus]GIE23427.1 hypothetical protein Ahu01nite_065290 [Actinoplanes humidus]